MSDVSLFKLRSMGDDGATGHAAEAAGRILPVLGRFRGPPTPRTRSRGLIEMFAASPTYQARVPAHLGDALLRVADAWEPRLTEASGRTGLAHGDFNSRNIFVAPDGDAWRVSGVLDWEFAMDAATYVDIGNFLRYERPERPRFEPHFSRGLRDGGMELPPDWLTIARMMDLPALCELMTRPGMPRELVSEVLALIEAVVQEATRA